MNRLKISRSKGKQFPNLLGLRVEFLNILKTKNVLQPFFSNDIEKIMMYKSYTNKLESTSKINYYKAQFEKCKTNLKVT